MASKPSGADASSKGGIQVRRAAPNNSTPPPRRPSKSSNIRMITIPLTAVTVGIIFFMYSRTSIQAAKVNAQRHRDADGGSISWRNESLRRHGALEKPKERGILQQLVAPKEENAASRDLSVAESKRLELEARKQKINNPIEEGIRRAREGKGGGSSSGDGGNNG